jgi:Kef-type K+ transport system membrane component KefB
MNNVGLAVQFFAQIAVILVACRVVGSLAKRIGQPQVVAEMITGVLLGPSLLGLFFPEWQAFIFPWDTSQTSRDTQSYLFPVAQLGLALYMFIVGLEFRVDIVAQNLKCSIAVSLAGMIAPFILGAVLGWYFFTRTDLFPERTSASEAMLFLGAAMCITAFPMLARIIQFKQLTGTRMGTIAIGAGALDDATAWCLLAVVLASFDNDWSLAIQNIGGGMLYVAIALIVIRPLLTRTQNWFLNEGQLNETGLTIGIALMALGAWFTDLIGLHAVFGAFIMGTAMPRGAITRGLMERIQPLAVTLLLPLFFTYSGLNTKIGLLNSWSMWGLCSLVLLAAVIGKGGGCWLAAILSRLPNREALGIATLMNSRGLMELIVINIGLERGIISESLFAMLVIMAILTTLAASPLFDRLVGPEMQTNLDLAARQS